MKSFHFKDSTLNNLATVCTLMVEAQDQVNATVHPEWHAQGRAWMRAAWTEVGEAMGHTTWEWWKNLDDNYYDVFREKKDIAEFHMELVDALHFLLSHHINDHLGDGTAPVQPFARVNASQNLLRLFDRAYYKHTSKEWHDLFSLPNINGQLALITGPDATLLRVEELTKACLEGDLVRAFDMLVETAEHTELGLTGLIGLYFAKSALNKFRAANGYKEKTYIKSWGDGKEDNYYLNYAVGSQLEDMPLDRLLAWLADGSWVEELTCELAEMYDRVKRNGHAHHESASALSLT